MSNDSALLMDDAKARIDALDVTRSFIIQAPAGSGKTELLIQRFLSLLCVVAHPEEVIAITFTRKAAAEMQARVIAALRLAKENVQPVERHERETFAIARRVLARSDSQHWNVIGNSRRLRILTLDALNASITRRQPLAAGSTNAHVVVGAELNAMHEKAAIATLDWLADSGDMRDATLEVLRHVDNNTWLYTTYLSQMLATRDQWLPFIGSGLLTASDARRLRQRFEASIEIAVTDHLSHTLDIFKNENFANIPDLLSYAADNLVADSCDIECVAALCGRSDWPAANPDALMQWRAIAELLLTQKGQFRKRVDKRQGFPPSDKEKKDAMQSSLAALSQDPEFATQLHGVISLPPSHYSDEQWSVLVALFRLLPLAVVELKRLFAEKSITDHVEIALLANRALGTPEAPGDIALLFDYQVKHLLIDEMQDTSAAQYRLLETLVGGWQPGDGRSLCCVGDPMQSIYRFRNAEVGQFLLAKEFGIGQVQLETLVLRRNFRSGEKLVDWFNDVFPTILARKDDPLSGAVSYADAVSVPKLRAQGRCVIHPIFGANTDDEAMAGCELIAGMLSENPDDDMAVLVRGRTQLPQLLANLRSANIPYRAVEIDRLTDLPEIIDLLALARAAAHQGDRIAWLAILRGPWIGLDWTDLHTLVGNNSNSTVWELICDSGHLSKLSAYARTTLTAKLEVLSLLVRPRRSQRLREVVEQTWFALGGPGLLSDDYALDNVYKFFDVLSRLERAGTIVDVAELESTLDLERVSSNDNARLQIMTMHRSKGLQFDHVLLYGLGRQPGRGDRRVLSWFDLPTHDGVERKVISPVGPRSEIDNDPVHRYIEKIESEKNQQEQARLLYVACTRARYSLHLMGNTAVSNDGEDFKAARSDSLLDLLWPAVEPVFREKFMTGNAAQQLNDETPWTTPQLRRFDTPWQLPDVGRMPGTAVTRDSEPSDPAVEFYWVGSEARIAGTLVHRWLQMMTETATLRTDKISDAFRTTTRRWLREFGVNAASADPILSRVEDAVLTTLRDERGQWLLTGDGHAELALSGVYEEQLVSVILDRVRIDGNTHWIVDYKTSSHEGGDLEGFLRAETDRYRPQLARYSAVYSNWAACDARCALYFPLLGRFVEVDV